MSISRRSVIRSAVAAGAGIGAASVLTTQSSSAAPAAGPAAGPVGDVVGKVSVGYQGWFAATGDGSPANQWWHYDTSTHQPPTPADCGIKAWPDMRDFTTTFKTGFADLGNGRPATLFSSWSDQTVDTHVKWAQQYGIDTFALQRFHDQIPTRNGMATKLRTACEKYDRKFYVMYDISGWTDFDTLLQSDWRDVLVGQLKLTSSPAYAKQNGKPVVCVWGLGFSSRPGTAAQCLAFVNFLKAQGCYVIGGVPRPWRTEGAAGTKPGFQGVYDALDMITPWVVGGISSIATADSNYTNYNVPDQAYCDSHGIDYQPCVLPGDTSLRQRLHGDLMWRQFYNVVRAGAQGIYISMYDEFNEGNQIAKTAEDASMVPTNGNFPTLDEDGTKCSSDYYLRLTGDGGRMLKKQIALTATRPTQPMLSGGGTAPGTTAVLGLGTRADNSQVTADDGVRAR